MVRLIPIELHGKIVWMEDSPTVYPDGHEGQLVPGQGPCPVCGWPIRSWKCRADGCEAADQYDDEHVHHGAR